MSKHLKDKDIGNIVEILDDWTPDVKLTWVSLVKRIYAELGIVTTRQTIQKYVRIKSAYQEVRAIYSGKSDPSAKKATLPPSLKIAADRINVLQRKVERLERENSQLLEQFQTWSYNAYVHGLSFEKLNEPLPPSRRK
jgi:predicted nuclease with TOPRIM domain